MNQKTDPKLNEKGFASIVIALIFIIVLALLTVGFAQLSRREQQNALDKQLATQANYAAESGINAAFKDIQNGYITTTGAPKHGIPTVKADDQTCMPASKDPYAATYQSGGSISHPVNSGNGVTYSCLLVQLQTPNLQSNCVAPGSGHHMNFGTVDSSGNPVPLTSLTIYWGSCSGNNSNFPNDVGTKFLPWNTWASRRYPPVIEFSITPVSSLSAQSNPTQYLIDHTTNVYLYPAVSGNSSCSTGGGGACEQGQVLSGDCNPSASRPAGLPDAKDYPCSATLTGLGNDSYVLHYLDFYDSSNLYAYGTVNSGGSNVPAKFTGEPMIDATGKARNVLKRMQARLLINNGSPGQPNDNDILPNSAVEAKNLCKRIQAAPPVNDWAYKGSTYDTLGGINGPCNLSN